MQAQVPFFGIPLLDDASKLTTDAWYRFFATLAMQSPIALTAAPTGNKWTQGQFIWNSTPSELGTAPNKYVVLGWICTVSGTPGTWLPCRVLTGN